MTLWYDQLNTLSLHLAIDLTSMSKNQVTVSEQKIICQDNAELAATLYVPSTYLEEQASSQSVTGQSGEAGSSNTSLLKGAVLIGPATGVKRQFYANFANYLAESGYAVLTYDNRGIGESNNQSVNHGDITLQSWGEQDFSAAINHLKNYVPQTKYHLVGHSAGGQLIGLSPESKQLSSVFNFACSSGRLKNMTPANRIKAHFFHELFHSGQQLFIRSHQITTRRYGGTFAKTRRSPVAVIGAMVKVMSKPLLARALNNIGTINSRCHHFG